MLVIEDDIIRKPEIKLFDQRCGRFKLMSFRSLRLPCAHSSSTLNDVGNLRVFHMWTAVNIKLQYHRSDMLDHVGG